MKVKLTFKRKKFETAMNYIFALLFLGTGIYGLINKIWVLGGFGILMSIICLLLLFKTRKSSTYSEIIDCDDFEFLDLKKVEEKPVPKKRTMKIIKETTEEAKTIISEVNKTEEPVELFSEKLDKEPVEDIEDATPEEVEK